MKGTPDQISAFTNLSRRATATSSTPRSPWRNWRGLVVGASSGGDTGGGGSVTGTLTGTIFVVTGASTPQPSHPTPTPTPTSTPTPDTNPDADGVGRRNAVTDADRAALAALTGAIKPLPGRLPPLE
ncbi:MAG: hypothetical protein WDM88_11055 [Galbitalea sp.]